MAGIRRTLDPMPEDVDWYGSPDAARWSTTGASPLPGSLLDRIEARLGLEARIIAEGYADLGPDTIGVTADWEVLVQELGRSGGPSPYHRIER